MGQQNFDTTYTKIFVGNLAWRITAEDLRRVFQQFGPIIHANVVYQTYSGQSRSKGYGFVTFADADSAIRAYQCPYPIIIEGRRINFNLASFPENPNFANYPLPYVVHDYYGNEYYTPYYDYAHYDYGYGYPMFYYW